MFSPLDILSWETWILIGTCLILTRLYIHRKWQVLKNLNIPHDPPSILKLGHMLNFLDLDCLFTIDAPLKKKYGYIYGTYSWLSPRITICDPEILKQIMIKEAGTFIDRQKTFSKVNGKEMNTALTAASGDQWKRIRNTISPTFSTSKLKDMSGIVELCTDKTIESLQKLCKEENGRFHVKDLFGNLSMDVICSAAFGVNVHSQDEGGSELVEKSKKVFSKSFFGLIAFLILVFPWTEKVAEKLNYTMFDKELLAYYKSLINTVIKNKKAAKEKARMDILQGMLTHEISEKDVKDGAVKGVTRTEIIGNAVIMLIGGYETTASTLTFLAYCIATEKEVQEKLHEEVIEVKEKFGDLTYEAVNSLKYLDMCLKESMRLYGAVPRNSRYTDVEITVQGIKIPAGTHVGIPTYMLHHDEEYWQDPWKFIPERFEDMSSIDPMVYQPFGAGPRNCIGMRLAILEVKMAFAKIVLNFQLDTCEDTPKPPLKLTFRTSVQPKEDLYLRVVPRQQSN